MKSMFCVLIHLKGMLRYLVLSVMGLYIPSTIFLILHMFKQRKWANKKRVKTL